MAARLSDKGVQSILKDIERSPWEIDLRGWWEGAVTEAKWQRRLGLFLWGRGTRWALDWPGDNSSSKVEGKEGSNNREKRSNSSCLECLPCTGSFTSFISLNPHSLHFQMRRMAQSISMTRHPGYTLESPEELCELWLWVSQLFWFNVIWDKTLASEFFMFFRWF